MPRLGQCLIPQPLVIKAVDGNGETKSMEFGVAKLLRTEAYDSIETSSTSVPVAVTLAAPLAFA